MPRKIKVVESEKSTGVVHANWKQKEFLHKNVQLLNRSEKMVTSRITLNQRLTYKKYKQKLYRAKLNHARLVGDKAAERELRGNSDRFTFNTNYGLDPEDEEVLQKIWSRSSPTPSNVRPQTSPQRIQDDARPMSRGKSAMSVSRGAPRARPGTTLPDISRDKRGQYIATGGLGPVPPGSIDNGSVCSLDGDEEEECPPPNRPKTAHFAGILPTKNNPGRPPPRPMTTLPEAPQAPTIFEEDTRPSLLDVHREKIHSANYEGRVKTLCTKMQPFVVSKDYLIPDYYTVRLDDEMRAIRGNKFYAKEIPGTPLSDIKRAMGNMEVKSLTLKRITYDFHSPSELNKHMECLTI